MPCIAFSSLSGFVCNPNGNLRSLGIDFLSRGTGWLPTFFIMPVIAAEELEQLTHTLFQAAGGTRDEAAIVSRHLVEANLAGHDSHGVLRIPQYLRAIQSGELKLGANITVASDTPTTAVVDGGRGFGQTAGHQAMRLAIQKARQHGISAVASRNSYHTGRIASYPLMAAAEHLVAIVMVNAGGGGQSVAPFGGLSRRLATNPVAIALPSGGEFPILLDIATSVAPEGKVRDCHLKDKPVPAGWIIDAQGRPSTSPQDFYAPPGGALLPLGAAAGYKGFGLAFMIDILAGALSGAGCCRPEVLESRDGTLMIVIDIRRFVSLETFTQHVKTLVAHVKSCPPAPGFSDILVPGELEFREQKRRRREGVQVDAVTWQEIGVWAKTLGVPLGEARAVDPSPPLQGSLSKAV